MTPFFTAIAYGGGQFVIFSNGTILTSADGSNWAGHSDGHIEPALRGICYGNGHFVAVGQHGTIVESGSIISLGLTPSPGTSGWTVSVTGPIGLAYTIQSSPDLASWQTVTNFTSALATTVIFDALPAASGRRSYRAYAQGPPAQRKLSFIRAPQKLQREGAKATGAATKPDWSPNQKKMRR